MTSVRCLAWRKGQKKVGAFDGTLGRLHDKTLNNTAATQNAEVRSLARWVDSGGGRETDNV